MKPFQTVSELCPNLKIQYLDTSALKFCVPTRPPSHLWHLQLPRWQVPENRSTLWLRFSGLVNNIHIYSQSWLVYYLVGGWFTNPETKNMNVKMGSSSSSFGLKMKKTYWWNHHPVIVVFLVAKSGFPWGGGKKGQTRSRGGSSVVVVLVMHIRIP